MNIKWVSIILVGMMKEVFKQVNLHLQLANIQIKKS